MNYFKKAKVFVCASTLKQISSVVVILLASVNLLSNTALAVAPCEAPENVGSIDYDLCHQFQELKRQATLSNVVLEKTSYFKKWHSAENQDLADTNRWANRERASFIREELSRSLDARNSWVLTYEDFQTLVLRALNEPYQKILHREHSKTTTQYLTYINEEMNFFLTHANWGNRSPVEFAVTVYGDFIARFGRNDKTLMIAQLLGDLVLNRLGFPVLPVSTPEHEDAVKLAMNELILKLNGCLHLSAESTVDEVNECRDFYAKDIPNRAKFYEASIRSLVADLTNSGAPYQPTSDRTSILNALNYLGFSLDNRVNLNFTIEAKRRLFERLAEPLPNDLRTWSWVASRKAAFSRSWLYSNSYFFKSMIVGETSSNVGGKEARGSGLYVSRNPFDSAQYGLSSKALKESQDLSQDERDSQAGILFLVTIKKGQRILNLGSGAGNQSAWILQLFKIPADDASRYNPNVVIDYANGNNEWMNIKLQPTGSWNPLSFTNEAFEIKEAAYSDFLGQEIETIRERLNTNQVTIAKKFFAEIVQNYDRF